MIHWLEAWCCHIADYTSLDMLSKLFSSFWSLPEAKAEALLLQNKVISLPTIQNDYHVKVIESNCKKKSGYYWHVTNLDCNWNELKLYSFLLIQFYFAIKESKGIWSACRCHIKSWISFVILQESNSKRGTSRMKIIPPSMISFILLLPNGMHLFQSLEHLKLHSFQSYKLWCLPVKGTECFATEKSQGKPHELGHWQCQDIWDWETTIIIIL